MFSYLLILSYVQHSTAVSLIQYCHVFYCSIGSVSIVVDVSLFCLYYMHSDRLKKKYSTDFMAKDSAVWIDPQKRSLHWYNT